MAEATVEYSTRAVDPEVLFVRRVGYRSNFYD